MKYDKMIRIVCLMLAGLVCVSRGGVNCPNVCDKEGPPSPSPPSSQPTPAGSSATVSHNSMYFRGLEIRNTSSSWGDHKATRSFDSGRGGDWSATLTTGQTTTGDLSGTLHGIGISFSHSVHASLSFGMSGTVISKACYAHKVFIYLSQDSCSTSLVGEESYIVYIGALPYTYWRDIDATVVKSFPGTDGGFNEVKYCYYTTE